MPRMTPGISRIIRYLLRFGFVYPYSEFRKANGNWNRRLVRKYAKYLQATE